MSDRLIAARSFLAGHARVLDRRRFELLVEGGDAESVLAALGAYRNRNGGYGHGLEPDLRAPESQPVAAYHAFEVFADVAPVTAPEAAELCDWLDSVALPDGGLPFALPIEDPRGCAPFWARADPTAFSLQITAIVAAYANRVAAHDPAVAGHPGSPGPRATASRRSTRSSRLRRRTSSHSPFGSSTPSTTATRRPRDCSPASASTSRATACCKSPAVSPMRPSGRATSPPTPAGPRAR